MRTQALCAPCFTGKKWGAGEGSEQGSDKIGQGLTKVSVASKGKLSIEGRRRSWTSEEATSAVQVGGDGVLNQRRDNGGKRRARILDLLRVEPSRSRDPGLSPGWSVFLRPLASSSLPRSTFPILQGLDSFWMTGPSAPSRNLRGPWGKQPRFGEWSTEVFPPFFLPTPSILAPRMYTLGFEVLSGAGRRLLPVDG